MSATLSAATMAILPVIKILNNMKVQKQKIDLNTGNVINYEADVQSEQDALHNTYSLTFEGYISEWEEVKPLKTFKHNEFIKRHYWEYTEVAFQQAIVNPDPLHWVECTPEMIQIHNAQPLGKEYVNIDGESVRVQKFGWL